MAGSWRRRPGRRHALEALITTMQELPGLWITTAAEVATHVRSLDLTPRAFPAPVLPEEA